MKWSLVFVLIGFVGLAAPRAQHAVDGNWALTFETPMGMLDATAIFKSDGEAFTGTMTSQAGATEFKGKIKGNAIDFIMNVTTPEGDLSIQLNAEVDGDELKGTFDFGQGVGNWTGKRVKSN